MHVNFSFQLVSTLMSSITADESALYSKYRCEFTLYAFQNTLMLYNQKNNYTAKWIHIQQ